MKRPVYTSARRRRSSGRRVSAVCGLGVLCAATCPGHARMPRRAPCRPERLRSGRVERGEQRSAGARLYINFVLHVYGGTQPCARLLTRHEAFRKRRACQDAAPHVCACGGRPLVRGRVWRHRGARARDACVPPSVGETEPTPPRGNPDESVAADASGATHGARRAHARERCGACWSSAQRAPEPAYARVT